MIKVFAKNARKFDLDSYDEILFSYHGLPQRQLRKGDRTKSHCLKVENCCSTICDSNKFCYSAQCHATTELIAKELGLKEDQYKSALNLLESLEENDDVQNVYTNLKEKKLN